MSRDGNGTYNLPEAAFVNGTTIDADAMNSDLSDIAAALTDSIANDGQTVPVANLPMGGFKHTNVAAASSRTDYARADQVIGATLDYADDTGSATAYAIAPSPGIASYVVGQSFSFKAANANSGSDPTLAINGLTAGIIYWPGGKSLMPGDITANALVRVTVATVTTGTPTFHLQTVSQKPARQFRTSTAVGANSKTFVLNDASGAFTFSTSGGARTATLPKGSDVGDGYFLEMRGLSSANGIVLAPDAGDGIDGGADGATKTIPGGVPFTIRWSNADDQWLTNYIAVANAPAYAGVRQTVAAGPVGTDGLPSLLPSTNAALSITTQNVSSSAPLVAAAANGWSSTTGEPVDTVGISTANLTWSGLTASRAAGTPNFLYATIAAGVITPASTILAPVYQWGGTPSTTNGQITFNIAEMKAYLGNGSTAPQTNLVVFGEAATDGSGVISTVAYAYNGRYESAFTATLPSTSTVTSANHNIGVYPEKADFIIQCTTADGGYSVGDQLTTSGGLFTATTLPQAAGPKVTNKTISVATANNVAWVTINGAGASQANLTAASWKYKFLARRGW